MRFAEIQLAYQYSFDHISHVVIARIDEPPHSPPYEHWVVLGSTSPVLTRQQIEDFQHVYPTAESAIRYSIAYAQADIAAANERIARLTAELAKESEAR